MSTDSVPQTIRPIGDVALEAAGLKTETMRAVLWERYAHTLDTALAEALGAARYYAALVGEMKQQAADSRVTYLLWSNKRQAWWRPAARGYTDHQPHAGRYSEADAVRYVVQSAQSGLLSAVTCMVAAPENWAAKS